MWALKRFQGRDEAHRAVQQLLRIDMMIHPVERRGIDAALPNFANGLGPRTPSMQQLPCAATATRLPPLMPTSLRSMA